MIDSCHSLRITALAVMLFLSTQARSQPTCGQQKAEFKRIVEPLLITQKDGEWIPASSKDPALTERAHQFLAQVLTDGLNADLNAKQLSQRIACVQAFEQYEMFTNETNVPLVSILDSERVIASYVIFRGGIAIPDVRPFVDLFVRSNQKWALKASEGDYFVASTFYVHKIDTLDKQMSWFLLTGRPIGGTGGTLRVQLLSVGDARIDTLWREEFIRSEVVQLEKDKLQIQSEDTSSGNPYREFISTYTITGTGLQYESRKLLYEAPTPKPPG